MPEQMAGPAPAVVTPSCARSRSPLHIDEGSLNAVDTPLRIFLAAILCCGSACAIWL